MATTRFYLDTRRSAEDGTSLLKLTFTKDRRNVYISLDVRLLPSQWDERNCRIVGRSDRAALNAHITRRKSDIDNNRMPKEEDAYIYLLYKNTYEKPIRAVGKQISGAEDAQAKEATTELRNAVLEQLARDWKTARDKSSPSHSPKLNEWEEPHVRFAPKLSDLIATFATKKLWKHIQNQH